MGGRATRLGAMLGLLSAWAAVGAEVPAKPPERTRAVPLLSRDVKVDGSLKDWSGGLSIKAAEEAPATASWTAKVALRGEALLVGVELGDDQLLPSDLLEISVFFPNAGITARGYTYRFGADGKRPPDLEAGPPEFAQRLVQAAVQRRPKAMTLEVAIPVRALPRFPAKEAPTLELCIAFHDRDAVGGPDQVLKNCEGGSMLGGPLRLPDELRKAVKVKPPERVLALEARPTGWLGYGTLHYPSWAAADEDLGPDTLRSLISDAVVDPKEVRIPLPNRMSLPNGQQIFGVLSGKDPYEDEGECDPEIELRVALYVVTGKAAERVLEWPVSTCALGRAVSISLSEEGELIIGYSNGSTTQFTWSNDHFERTEYGMR